MCVCVCVCMYMYVCVYVCICVCVCVCVCVYFHLECILVGHIKLVTMKYIPTYCKMYTQDIAYYNPCYFYIYYAYYFKLLMTNNSVKSEYILKEVIVQ